MSFKIYTKTGDKGETGLFGGARVAKFHERVEAYGTLDELSAFIGVVRDALSNANIASLAPACETLKYSQDRLFSIGSHLASDPNTFALPADVSEKDIEQLELEMDEMDKILTPLQNFILAGGDISVSFCHVARTVCRRAERLVVALAADAAQAVDPICIAYLNRLSDYLFVLARFIAKNLNIEEVIWKGKA
jgi:cob(I)alamin adenosyltransferase